MGASVARNTGIAASNGAIIAFTDDDCEPSPDWLAVIVECFASDPFLGVVGGAVVPPDEGPRGWLTSVPAIMPSEVRYDPPTVGGRRPPGCIWIGANVAMRRDIPDLVGPFDECLGPGTTFPGGEDSDFKHRIEAAGVVTLATPRSTVQHTHGVRSGVRAGLRHSRNYARGNGAMAAKLTLQGDPFGRQWRSQALRGASGEWRRDIRPHRIPVAVSRRWHFARAYREVLAKYEAVVGGVLVPSSGADADNLAQMRSGRA
jgi:GT2 family glycosyltransferase